MEIIGHDVNCETGEVTPIYLTPEIKAMQQKVIDDQKSIADSEAAKASAKAALLAQLGITADEAKLLLG